VESIAADANVILSAITGKAALKVFTRSSVAVVTTQKTLLEVREYLPEMAARYDLSPELIEAQLALLALRVPPAGTYARKLKEAQRRIGQRDPDDVESLALALALDIPVWSNDNDFARTGVKRYTTAELLRALRVR
jgi:predicted nucleic acid-binding protein